MNCLVIGLGKSGYGSAKALLKGYNKVTVLEEFLSPDNQERANELEGLGANIVSQSPDMNFDLIIPSPGIPYHHKALSNTKAKVISEVELAYQTLKPSWITAVTGTNGKTTTVNMIDMIYKNSGKGHLVAGNIGEPMINLHEKDLSQDHLILELSSFQLHLIDTLRANVAVILNITEDHIDWHKTFDHYLRSKANILINQRPDDFAIINIDDKYTKKLISSVKSRLLTISTLGDADFCLKDGKLNAFGKPFMGREDLKLIGDHNVINALTASAAAYCAQIPEEDWVGALKAFKGLEHRLEVVSDFNGRIFINDSKSTNPDSSAVALQSMDRPVILLLGGKNKGNAFQCLPMENVKELICFGEAGSQLSDALGLGYKEKSLRQAVSKALKVSSPGDIILLSPGCASFDEFSSYKDRGNKFKQYISELV